MINIRELRRYRLKIFTLYWTLTFYLKGKVLWKIKIGKNCIFNGKTILYRKEESEIKIGNNCRFVSEADNLNLIGINRPCIIATHAANASIEIGNSNGFSGTVIGAFKHIKIGNNIKCGANTLITDSDWHLEDYRSGEPKEVIIGDNVWLGVNSIVLKGVTIGDNAVIGANSVVTKNIPTNAIAAGNPCKVLRIL